MAHARVKLRATLLPSPTQATVSTLQVAPTLAQGEHIGDGLAGVSQIRQQVDDRYLVHLDHVLEGGVVEDPGTDHPVVASQDLRDVLDALPHAQADLLAPDAHGVAAQADHGHLGGVSGSVRGLLEDQGHPPAGEHLGRAADLGQVEDLGQLGGTEIVDFEKVSHRRRHTHRAPGLLP